jgi:serine protease Do
MKSRNLSLLALSCVIFAYIALSSPGLGLAQSQTGATPPPPPAPATASPLLPALNELQTALEQVYRSVNPSVVTISGVLPPEEMNDAASDEESSPLSELLSRIPQPLGSGFIWDPDGHIVTNNHVVDKAERLSVTLSNGLTVPAILIGHDVESDLAVLKVDFEDQELQPIAVADSTQAQVGQLAVVIGNPFGLHQGTMNLGIVSALGRTWTNPDDEALKRGVLYEIPDMIQTDAAINPGNSGGALLDMNGQLMGVPTGIFSVVPGSTGVGFAIPSVIVQRVVKSLIETGKYAHPWLGIKTTNLAPEQGKAMSLPKQQLGALVLNLDADGPGDKAGLRGSSKHVREDDLDWQMGGDLITAIDDWRVTRADDVDIYVARYTDVGDVVTLRLLRDGKEIETEVTVDARPDLQQEKEQHGKAWLGVEGTKLAPEVARAMGLPPERQGMLVESVFVGSPADRAGLRGGYKSLQSEGNRVMIGGDVIIAADGVPVVAPEKLAGILAEMSPGDSVKLTMLRDGKEMELEVKLAASPAASM